MSTRFATPPPPLEAPQESRSRYRRIALLVLAGFVLLCLVRVITGANQLTSSGTLAVTLTATMPIAMCGLGGLWSERAGVVNIGLEGMLIMGTLGAGYFGFHYGVWAGVLGATLLGLIGGALHALATVVFGVDHIVSGVAINIIALGVRVPRRGMVQRTRGWRPDAVAAAADAAGDRHLRSSPTR